MELLNSFQTDMAASAVWVPIWVNTMGAVLLLAVPFSFVRTEARWVLLAMFGAAVTIIALYSQIGYQRILGVGHILFWTPVWLYLLARRKQWRVRETLSGKWIVLVVLIMTISLAIDYADTVRWLAGDRGTV